MKTQEPRSGFNNSVTKSKQTLRYFKKQSKRESQMYRLLKFLYTSTLLCTDYLIFYTEVCRAGSDKKNWNKLDYMYQKL
jgi:hypothetical protein